MGGDDWNLLDTNIKPLIWKLDGNTSLQNQVNANNVW
jgi:hypothetical protein